MTLHIWQRTKRFRQEKTYFVFRQRLIALYEYTVRQRRTFTGTYEYIFTVQTRHGYCSHRQSVFFSITGRIYRKGQTAGILFIQRSIFRFFASQVRHVTHFFALVGAWVEVWDLTNWFFKTNLGNIIARTTVSPSRFLRNSKFAANSLRLPYSL